MHFATVYLIETERAGVITDTIFSSYPSDVDVEYYQQRDVVIHGPMPDPNTVPWAKVVKTILQGDHEAISQLEPPPEADAGAVKAIVFESLRAWGKGTVTPPPESP